MLAILAFDWIYPLANEVKEFGSGANGRDRLRPTAKTKGMIGLKVSNV